MNLSQIYFFTGRKARPPKKGRKKGETGTFPPPKYSQSFRLFEAFGGHRKLWKALGGAISLSTILRWGYAYPRGTDGLVPPSAWRLILPVADRIGVVVDLSLVQPSFPGQKEFKIWDLIRSKGAEYGRLPDRLPYRKYNFTRENHELPEIMS